VVLAVTLAFFHGASSFERNAGQLHDGKGNTRSDVRFIHQAHGYAVLLLDNGFSYQFHAPIAPKNTFEENGFPFVYHRIDVTFEEANKYVRHSASLPIYSNTYYQGQGKMFISETVDTVTYHQVYDGVDIRFISTGRSFKYDIICSDKKALLKLKLRFNGHLGPLQVSENGVLTFITALGSVAERIPLSFLQKGEATRNVEVVPIVSDDGVSVRFEMTAPWPSGHELVIDPAPHLLWSTYAGGEGMDEFRQVEMDADGNIYVSGFTSSEGTIATAGAHQGTLVGFQNCFLQKYSPQGQKLFGTYFGGQSADRCYGMTREQTTGNIYLSGSSFSAGIATAGTHQQALASPDDGLLVKFGPDGDLLWATYFGGNGHDFIAQLDIDVHGDLVMTGHTRSTNGIATDMTFLPGSENAFIAKFSPDGYQLWGTYLGGSYDEGWGIGSDDAGNIFICGETSSASGISTSGSHQPDFGGVLDAFLVKYNTYGQQVWGTYFGGTASDRATALRVCDDGSVAMVGNTESPDAIVSPTAFQAQPGSLDDAFLARFDSDGELLWSTYVGGEGVDYLTAVAQTPDGDLLVAGRSESTAQVTTTGAHQILPAGEYDAWLMRYSASGLLQWGTLIGGQSTEFANDVDVEPLTGHVIMVGMTKSSDGIATESATATDYLGGLYDGFIARFCIPPAPSVIAPAGVTICGSGLLPFQLDESGLSVLWSNGSWSEQLAFQAPEAGQFEVFADVTDGNGCPGRSDTITVTAFDAYEPDFEIMVSPFNEICIGATAQLGLSETFAGQEWWNGSSEVETSFTGTSSSAQWLHVTVFNDDGCASTDSILMTTQLCTSAEQTIDEVSLSIHPNPSLGSVVMQWPGNEGELMDVTVYALTGQVVLSTQQLIGQTMQLPLVAGSYLVACRSATRPGMFAKRMLLKML
jgi:hypothetical protein